MSDLVMPNCPLCLAKDGAKAPLSLNYRYPREGPWWECARCRRDVAVVTLKELIECLPTIDLQLAARP